MCVAKHRGPQGLGDKRNSERPDPSSAPAAYVRDSKSPAETDVAAIKILSLVSRPKVMKKSLQYTVLVLLVLVLVAYVTAQYFLGSIVEAGVNRAGPKLTQSNVVLEDAKISPLSGTGTLTGLSVGNPAGWSEGRAIYLGKMHLDVEPTSFLGDAIVVNDLTIDQPEFVYETRLVSSNIGDLMKNIEAALGAKPDPQDKEAEPRKIIVKHFRLQNAKVTIGMGTAALPLTLPPLELSDLGVKEGGLTPSQLAFAIMKEVTPEIVAATTKAAGSIGGTMGAAAGEAVKKAGEGLQKLLGGSEKNSRRSRQVVVRL
jgi:hypothetical protein